MSFSEQQIVDCSGESIAHEVNIACIGCMIFDTQRNLGIVVAMEEGQLFPSSILSISKVEYNLSDLIHTEHRYTVLRDISHVLHYHYTVGSEV